MRTARLSKHLMTSSVRGHPFEAIRSRPNLACGKETFAEQAMPVLQPRMRHAEIKTAFRFDAHTIPQTQRDVMES
jgi:hypothetical protein